MSAKKTRQVNLPGSRVGKQRQMLYAAGVTRIREAIDSGYALEAIALCESLMSDRLEARWAWKGHQSPSSRSFSTLGNLARKLRNDRDESDEALKIYEAVAIWAAKRNSALHEMFKLSEGEVCDWQTRYNEFASVAADGFMLSKKVSALLKKTNKPPL